MKSNTTQFSKVFFKVVTKLWNDLPNHVVKSMQLHNFKRSATLFLSGIFKYPDFCLFFHSSVM